MKINLTNKLLIGTMALSSCQKPAQQVTHIPMSTVIQSVDTYGSSFNNGSKVFDILKNGIFNGGLLSVNLKAPVRKKYTPKRPHRTKSTKQTPRKTPVRNTPIEPVSRKLSPTVNNGSHWITGSNISYAHPTEYTIPKGNSQSANKIANANGVSLYRLKLANPNLNLERPIPSGTVVNIPGKYVVTPGSVKSFDDVVKTTKINKHYINDILICIEGRHKKPDLVCKSDRVKSKEYPNGCPTIGFGHTGRVDGKIIVNGRTRITEAKAYEILAQDILDAKTDALVYMGKDLFNRAPESIQTGIIDIVFNKGVEPFTRSGSPTTLIKNDLQRGDYASAAAHTVLKTGNRGLKKRNVYRVILSTNNLSQQERNRTLSIAHPHYIETLGRFPGRHGSSDRFYMQKAWANAKKGITHGFFEK